MTKTPISPEERARRRTREYIDEFIKKYVSPALANLAFGNILDNRVIDVYVTPDVPTACVKYDDKTDKFLIFLGCSFDMFKNIDTEKDIVALVEFFLLHECGHTLFTEMDFERINEECEKYKIPFDFINLAEDGRMEEHVRRYYEEQSGMPLKLNRSKYMQTPKESANMSPESILFAIINEENSRPIHAILYDEVFSFYKKFIGAVDVWEVIQISREWKDYFHDPYAKQEQGEDQENKQDGQGESCDNGSPSSEKGKSDKKESGSDGEDADNEMSENMKGLGKELGEDGDGGLSEEEKEIAEMFGDGNEAEHEKESPNQSELNKKSLEDLDKSDDAEEIQKLLRHAVSATEEKQNAFVYPVDVDASVDFTTAESASNSNTIFDPNRGALTFDNRALHEEVMPELEKLRSKSMHRTVATKRPSKRFNPRTLSRVSTTLNAPIYRTKSETTLKLDKKNICVCVDLSGSMQAAMPGETSPVEAARTLLVGLNRLCKIFPNLNVTVIGIKQSGRMPSYQGVVLQTDENALLSIDANGGAEGIGYALKEILRKKDNRDFDLLQQETLVVLTDGNMGHHDINDMLDAFSNGLNSNTRTVGVYVGSPEYKNDKMVEWFDETVFNPNLGEVTQELVEIFNKDTIVRMEKGIIINDNPAISHKTP